MAGHFPLDRASVKTIGRALGRWIAAQSMARHVVMGQDTRLSSAWIAEALIEGLAKENVAAENAGVLTTPGVAFLARTRDFAAGIVISASHNPWTDNGIKVFGHDGYKLQDFSAVGTEWLKWRSASPNGLRLACAATRAP
jgi:phosphoglucosamine mutase